MPLRAVIFAIVFVVLATGAAGAHAAFEASVPAAGERLERAPTAVVLSFDDGVDLPPDAIRVLDAAGTERALGAPFHPHGDARTVAIATPGLARGRYVVIWHVVSDDAHVVGGAFAFGVGEAAGEVPAADLALGDPDAGPILAVLRFFLLGALMLAIGLAAGPALIARSRDAVAPAMLEFGAWLVLAFTGFVDIGVRALFAGSNLPAELGTRFGGVRVAFVAAGFLGAIAVAGTRRRWLLLAIAAGAATLFESLAGHAATGLVPIPGVIADALHTLAAATWIGVLVTVLRVPHLVDARRASAVAATTAGVIALTAVVQVLRNVATWGDLVTTPYGILILAKIVLFLAALAIALVSRSRVSGDARALVPTVRLEAIVLSCVILVTAVLVDGAPPRAVAHEAPAAASDPRVLVIVHVVLSIPHALPGAHGPWYCEPGRRHVDTPLPPALLRAYDAELQQYGGVSDHPGLGSWTGGAGNATRVSYEAGDHIAIVTSLSVARAFLPPFLHRLRVRLDQEEALGEIVGGAYGRPQQTRVRFEVLVPPGPAQRARLEALHVIFGDRGNGGATQIDAPGGILISSGVLPGSLPRIAAALRAARATYTTEPETFYTDDAPACAATRSRQTAGIAIDAFAT